MSQSRPSAPATTVADRGRGAGSRGGGPAVGPGRAGRRRRADTGAVPVAGSASASEAFFASALDGAPRWVSGALAAAQAAILSLLALVLPAVAAFVATAADPSNAGVSWFRAVQVGGALWLAGHGVPLTVGGVAISLVPLGITALAVFTCYASARRSAVPTRSAYLAGVGTYVAGALLVALLVGTGPVGLVRTVAGAALVAAIGLGTGMASRSGAPSVRTLTAPVWVRVPRVLRVGAGAAAMVVAALVAVASVVTALWVVAGLATIRDVVDGLGLGAVGGTVLAFGELSFAPNLVVWAIAWIAGPGFAVGAGTHFAPHEVVAGPMPAVPILGALPSNTLPGLWSFATPLLLAGLGAAAGWYVHRRIAGPRWWHPVAACACVAGVAAALVSVLVVLASGGIGPGRMAHVGASALLVGIAVAWPLLFGSAAVALPTDPAFRAVLRRATRRGSAPSD
ncbi:cell division protein PerM [Cellulomonas edaphi]|uniref:DUF6350 family protein n=1 Tax=Cellulomonas edaphi TaxID=3053468 RepID=A0ABT7S8H3_9CELL|nr:DUF6350 family protein [Cellulomons edaphi]MDM7831931.1 DUF6350 family protein [Cellulomons edaphi]